MEEEKVSDKILKELKFIANSNPDGLLIPEEVVKFAKNPKTKLHSQFEWDNSVAAENWRLHQARNLIRVTVDLIPNNGEETVRAFVSLKSDRQKGNGYRPMVSVLSDAQLREELLQDALEDFEVFKLKYRALRELSKVFEEMEKISKKHNPHPARKSMKRTYSVKSTQVAASA